MLDEKFIGTVLWFGTSEGVKYGFIEYHNHFGGKESVFFHKNKIAKPSIFKLEEFVEGQIVTFSVKQSDRNPEKTEAHNVLLVNDDKDKEFLLLIFFLLVKANKDDNIYKELNKIIKSNIDDYLKLNYILDEELNKIIDDFFKLEKASIFSKYIDDNEKLYQNITNNINSLFLKSDSIVDKINAIADIFSTDSNTYNYFILNVLNKLTSEKIIPFEKIESLKFIINIINKSYSDKVIIFDILKNQNLTYVRDILFYNITDISLNEKVYFVEMFKDIEFFNKNFNTVHTLRSLFTFIDNNSLDKEYYHYFSNLFINNFKNDIKNNMEEFILLMGVLHSYKLDKKIIYLIDKIDQECLKNILYGFNLLEINIKENEYFLQKLKDVYFFIDVDKPCVIEKLKELFLFIDIHNLDKSSYDIFSNLFIKSLEFDNELDVESFVNLLDIFYQYKLDEQCVCLVNNVGIDVLRDLFYSPYLSIIKIDNKEFILKKFDSVNFFTGKFHKVQNLKEIFIFIESNLLDKYYYETFCKLFVLAPEFNNKFSQQKYIDLINLIDGYKLDEKIIYLINDNINTENLEKIFYGGNFLSISKANQKKIVNKLLSEVYVNSLSDDDLSKIDGKLHLYQLYEESNIFINMLPIDKRIVLWIDDKISFFDYDFYCENICNINYYYQRLFVKKIFRLIAIGTISKNFFDVKGIKTNDYSTKIIFELINTLLLNKKIYKNSLRYDILKKLSELSFDINGEEFLQINDYFDLCQGRTCEYHRPKGCSISYIDSGKKYISDGNIIEDKQYYYVRENVEFVSQERKQPILCDGRWSVNKDGQLNISDGRYNFMWCRNKKCFDSSRKIKNMEDWRNYSLIDFLHILNIHYSSENIEILYATINHVNRFLLHMNCKSCGHLLKPKGGSNYSFYRVNTFDCCNENCINPDRNVYLSHCSNGFCDGTIDSRTSSKCINGWVICNECFACCDKEGLDKRNNGLAFNNRSPTIWSEPNGHRGRQILCPQCANPMIFKDINQKIKERKDVITNFEKLAMLDMPDNKKLVGKHGVNSFEKKWFVVYQRHINRDEFMAHLNYWYSLGFNITDFDDKTKYHYLVSEPHDEKQSIRTIEYYCQFCNCSYNHMQDYNKYWAVQHWHSVLLLRN